MSCTVKQLIAHCEDAIKQNVQYIYGAKWQVMSAQQINALRSRYGSNCVWDSDSNKAGKICCDCSGLISSATGLVRGSSQYKSTALESYPISKRTPAMRGWAVWMQGHIGIYDGNDGYYAMDGSARNAVHNPLSANKFTHIIKLCDVDYGTGATSTSAPKAEASGGAYNNKPDMHYIYKTLNRGWHKELVEGQQAWDANDAITALAIGVTEGTVKYRVHIIGDIVKGKRKPGKWLPYVKGFNINDDNNGYAGDGKHQIDLVEIYYFTPAGRPIRKAKYQVATVGKGFYSPQYDNEKSNGQDGYAGAVENPVIKFIGWLV